MFIILDVLFVLLILWVITQLFFPIIWPSDFEINWLFKKGGRTNSKIAKFNKIKREQSKAADALQVDADKKSKEADELRQTITKQ